MLELLSIRNRVAVDLLQDLFHLRLSMFTFSRIIPRERIQPRIARPRILPRFFLDATPQVVHKPGVAASVARRFHRLIPVLQQALRVGEGTVLLRGAGGREEEHLGRNVLRRQFAALHLRRIEPEGSGFNLHHVSDYQPLQLRQRAALQPSVRSAHRRVLSHDEQPFHLAVGHVEPIPEMRVVAGNTWQPVKPKIVFPGSGFAVVSLQQADQVLVESRPESGASFMLLDVVL